jgi:hypothetical protein
MSYVVKKHLTEDLMVIRHPEYGEKMWGIVKLRKETKCAQCKGALAVGARAFSPITNGYNRMHRLCLGCAGR